MAGSIKTGPVTKEYEEGFERALRSKPEPEPERKVREHDCEYCGHHMKYDDQRCGCTSKAAWRP